MTDDLPALLAAVRAADAAATPGPWRACGRAIEQLTDAGEGYPLDYYPDSIDVAAASCCQCGETSGIGNQNDAELVALYRTAAPRLAAEVAKLLDANGNLSREVARSHAVYLDIADSLLPSSTGPADLLAEIRRLQKANDTATKRAESAEAEVARLAMELRCAQIQVEDRGNSYAEMKAKGTALRAILDGLLVIVGHWCHAAREFHDEVKAAQKGPHPLSGPDEALLTADKTARASLAKLDEGES